MIIEKVELNQELENLIEDEQTKYEAKHGVFCGFTPFSFVAKENDMVVCYIWGDFLF